MKKREQYALIYQALSDENRIRILGLIAKEEKNAGELLEQLNIVQSTLSHHMKVLTESGLVTARKSGKWTYYAISGDVLEDAGRYLLGFRSEDAPAARPARSAKAQAVIESPLSPEEDEEQSTKTGREKEHSADELKSAETGRKKERPADEQKSAETGKKKERSKDEKKNRKDKKKKKEKKEKKAGKEKHRYGKE